MVWYGASLTLDLYGTLRAGRGAISRREVSVPFRIVTVRAGPGGRRRAVQVALEVCLALAVAPLVLGYDIFASARRRGVLRGGGRIAHVRVCIELCAHSALIFLW